MRTMHVFLVSALVLNICNIKLRKQSKGEIGRSRPGQWRFWEKCAAEPYRNMVITALCAKLKGEKSGVPMEECSGCGSCDTLSIASMQIWHSFCE